ncbi:MAG: glycosyltransferase [Mariniphaga sp.]
MIGCFFQEQASLLQQRYDVRVLFGISRPFSYLSALRQYRLFPWYGHACVKLVRADIIPTPPPVTAFEYNHMSFGEPALLASTIDAYRQMFNHLITEGWRPNILHAHATDAAGIIASRLSHEFKIPWVLTEHQVFALANYSEHRRRLMTEALLTATKLVAVSSHQLRSIAVHGIYRPIVVMGNLIDEEVFYLAESRRDPAQFRILTVTYPSPVKDCETFFHAIALLINRGHPDIMVTVIGNNSFDDLSRANTEEFERLAEKFGVEKVCRLIAHVPRSEMHKFYAECDVFVSTSVAETFGVSVREAMAVGRPAVCTASGGVEDDLSQVNGVKVGIGDYEAVADALISIKTGCLNFDPVSVRNSVVDKHGRQAFLDQMTGVYEDVMIYNQM